MTEIKKNSVKRVFITGGSGFIGTHLVRFLLSQGHQITIFDLVDTSVQHPRVQYVKGDIRNPKDLARLLTADIDCVYHFAAIVSVQECEMNPMQSFETNLLGTQNILNRLVELKKDKNIPVFFASSAAVYGDLCKPGHKLNETEALPVPLSFYGLHKYTSEQMIRLYCEKHELKGLSFRFFNVFGPGQKADSPYSGVISRFNLAFETNSEALLFNEGKNSRDFIHVTEIARACGMALEIEANKINGRVINLCTGVSVTIKEVFQAMSETQKKRIPHKLLPARSGDIEFSCGDPSLAQAVLGFTSETASTFN